MSTKELIKTYLNDQNIPFDSLVHTPFFSADQGEEFCQIHGISIPKNLVMTNKKKDQFWMITVYGNKKVSLNQLKKDLKIAGPKFSFAAPEHLEKLLKVEAGSVSPYGLIFDTEHQINFYLDEDFKKDTHVGFHPNLNTETWKTTQVDFLEFLKTLNRSPQWLSIPTVS